VSDTLDILREEIGTCREWIDDEVRRCSKPSDYVLWGKLILVGRLSTLLRLRVDSIR
jgi:hypothetical protein